jgi:RimJ/RimL family protein N-acetyltransferase
MKAVDLPLGTARLTLRLYADADLPAFADTYSRADVVRYLYEEPLSLEEARAAMQRKAARTGITEEGGGVVLVLERTEDGAYLGDVSLWVTDVPNRGAEVGFVLHPDHQRKGYGAEATRAVLDLAFGPFGLHRVVGQCDARNDASAGLLTSLGMRQEAHFLDNEYVKGEWTSGLTFAVLEDEWRQRASSTLLPPSTTTH